MVCASWRVPPVECCCPCKRVEQLTDKETNNGLLCQSCKMSTSHCLEEPDVSCLYIAVDYEFEYLARRQELYLLKRETTKERRARKKKIDLHKQICSFLRLAVDAGDDGHRRFLAWWEAFEDGTPLETAMTECHAMVVLAHPTQDPSSQLSPLSPRRLREKEKKAPLRAGRQS